MTHSASTTMPTRGYALSDIKRWFGEREVSKGSAYRSKVRDLHINAELISARVQGTEPQPYQVTIEFMGGPGSKPTILPECSCPVGLFCKHAAATLLVALERRDATPAPNPAVLAWAESVLHSRGKRAKAARATASPTAAATPAIAIHYVFSVADYYNGLRLTLLKGRIDSGQAGRNTGSWNNIERALVQPPQFASDDDLDIFRALWPISRHEGWWNSLPVDSQLGERTLQRILATGRAWFGSGHGKAERYTPLRPGAQREATLRWESDDYGQYRARLETTPPAPHLLPIMPPWYIDPAGGEAGPVDCGPHGEMVLALLQLPPLTQADLPLISVTLASAAPELPLPLQESGSGLAVIDAAPTGHLTLGTVTARGIAKHRGYHAMWGKSPFDYAVATLQYGDITVAADDPRELFVDGDGNTVRILRRPKEEKQLLTALSQAGFKPLPRRAVESRDLPAAALGLESEAQWERFFGATATALREAGWQLDTPADFRHHLLEVSRWEMSVSEEEEGWFDLDMGIVVEGRRLALAPLLYTLFRHDARWLDGRALERIKDSETVALTTDEGLRIALPAGRIKPLARTLIDLFDAAPGATLRLPKLDAARLAELADTERWQFHGSDDLRQLAERLRLAGQVKAIAPPRGFGLTLRPYQREGVAWLQYLREHALAGILADDMGLGKTAQTLAHLLLEKEAGRLDRPVLVVLPTSLVFNWQREAERFAPALKVLSLHGKERAAAFPLIPQHDLCLTTYPLLWRDETALTAHAYHSVILDEAQSVKNALSRAAGVVRKLDTRHRLCLTGTPLENHLGELWSQFDFLLPGFLGDQKQFTKRWRTPIEKEGDTLRRDLLSRRIAPFILRRRKEEVAKELPPKTIVMRTVQLEGSQRDLYETVRSAMDKKVRDEIASRGFNRSQIVILDALLKLRQVCCDPRLLDTPAAHRVKEHAKLDLLMEMVPELVEEGRRILIFSQFTSMLSLIETELDAAAIPYTLLTGRTRKREEAIRRFQEGEVPIFLISLKAGGVGLNLTAADTVIHYDPWWNPAAENQATDRAHRIGQKKSVFVYKLIAAGSIEEKIVALQEKKAGLAAGILGEDASALAKFSESDISALLAPLPK